MNPETLLSALRSPSGLDMPALVFQVLLVLTWAVHIAFVHMTVGSLTAALYGSRHREDWGPKLAAFSGRVAVISLSLAVVFGVAPLLFVQVIYDPAWYTANVLSAWWVIAFVPTVILAYYTVYPAYFRAQKGRLQGGWLFLLLLGLGLVLLAGAIMHLVAYQSLFPERWVDWYTDGGRTMNTAGTRVYAFNPFRYLLFLLPGPFVYGVFLRAYAHYLSPRADVDASFLATLSRLGEGFARLYGPLALLAGLGYLVWDGLLGRPVLLLFLLLAGLLGWLALRAGGFFPPLGLLLGAEAGLSLLREADRLLRYGALGHTPYDYPYHFSPWAFLLFLATFVMGATFYAYFLRVLYLAGRSPGGTLTEEGAAVLSGHQRLSWRLLVAWVAVFLGFGAVVAFFLNR